MISRNSCGNITVGIGYMFILGGQAYLNFTCTNISFSEIVATSCFLGVGVGIISNGQDCKGYDRGYEDGISIFSQHQNETRDNADDNTTALLEVRVQSQRKRVVRLSKKINSSDNVNYQSYDS